MIEGFLSWWVRHLVAWLPAGWRAASRPDGLVATVLPDGGVRLGRRRRGRVMDIRRVEPGGALGLGGGMGRVVLVVPGKAMLRRSVELPLAAERNLGQVLRHEVDRLTPFTADEADWTWTVEARDKARGRVRVGLLLAPRALLAELRDAFAAAGHPVAALESEAGVIALGGVGGGTRWRRWAVAAGVGLCAVLGMAAVAVPFVRQSMELGRVERRIAAMRPEVDRADALRRRIAAGTAGADVVAAQAAASGEALAIVALVTDVLPDDTFLSELGWRSRQLTMTGQSAAASHLIEVLSRDPAVRNPVFAAPVTRDEAARVDRFSIRAEVVP